MAAWSFNFIMGKIGLAHLGPLRLASFRIVLAGLIMAPVYAFSRLRRSGSAAAAPRRWSGRDLWRFVYLGFFGVVINQGCFTVGLDYTTVGHSALITGLGPIWILLLAWAQGLEALTARKTVGMVLAFVGVTIIAAEHGLSLHSVTLRGDLITLAGSLGFSLYTVLGKKVAAAYDTVTMNACCYFAGALLALPVAVHEARQVSGEGGWGQIAWQGWAATIYMAGVSSVLAYLAYYWALRYLSASRLGSISYLNPVLSTLLGVGLLGERLTASLGVGGALVLLGVWRIESGPAGEKQRTENYAAG